MLVLLLAACAAQNINATDVLGKDDSGTGSGDTDTAPVDDSGDTADSAVDTDTGPDLGPYDSADGNYPYDCAALTSPIPVSEGTDILAAIPLQAMDSSGISFAVMKTMGLWTDDPGDCSLTFDGAGRAIVNGGDEGCTTGDGSTFTGMFVQEVDGDVTYVTFTEFHMDYAGAEGTMTFEADGEFDSTMAGWASADLWYSYSFDGTGFPGSPGEFIRHQETTSTWSETSATLEGKGYVDVLSSTSLPNGELCFAPDGVFTSIVDGCSMEPDGTTRLDGDAVAIVAFDGSSECDACFNLTLDGVDKGKTCF